MLAGEGELEWLAGVIAVLDSGGAVAFRKFESAETQNFIMRQLQPVLETHRAGHAAVPPAKRELSDLWGVFWTSGTSGRAAVVARSDFSLLTEIFGWTVELGLLQCDTVALCHPAHYAGSVTMIATALTVGAAIQFCGPDHEAESDPFQFADAVITGPPQLRRYLAKAGNRKLGAHVPRLIVVTGEPTDIATIDLCHQVFLGARIIVAWGTTEGLGTVADVTAGLRRPCHVGRPFVSEHIFAVGGDKNPLPHNSLGMIAGRVDSSSMAWPSQCPLVADELLVSNDVGYTDDAGHVYVLGRDSDWLLINRLWPQFTLTELETQFREGAGATEAVLTQLSHGANGRLDVGLALEAPQKPNHLGDIITNLEKTTSTSIRTLAFNNFPKTSTGKIDRASIRDRMRSGIS